VGVVALGLQAAGKLPWHRPPGIRLWHRIGRQARDCGPPAPKPICRGLPVSAAITAPSSLSVGRGQRQGICLPSGMAGGVDLQTALKGQRAGGNHGLGQDNQQSLEIEEEQGLERSLRAQRDWPLSRPLDPVAGSATGSTAGPWCWWGWAPAIPTCFTVAAGAARSGLRRWSPIRWGDRAADRNGSGDRGPWLTPQAGPALPLLFPMAGRHAPRRLAWRRRRPIRAGGGGGRRPAVVLLCEGDVSLFASASYALLALAGVTPTVPPAGLSRASTAAGAAAGGGPFGPWPLQQPGALLVRTTPDQPEARSPARFSCRSHRRSSAPIWCCSKLGPGAGSWV